MKSPQPRWVPPSALCAVALAAVVLASNIGATDADVLTGRIYPLEDRGGQPLFTWQFERDVVGSTWRSSYRTPAGDLSATDELIWDGDMFKSYRYERPPAGEIARVDRQGQEVVYEQRVGGITRRNRERFDEQFTVGPTVIPWVQRHWNDITAGRELTIRYAVLDQLRSFEFRLAMADDHPRADRDIVVKMWPASLVLRLFVSPVYLVFTRDGRAFHGMIGRLLPVVVHDGKLRPIDGHLVLDPSGASGRGRQ